MGIKRPGAFWVVCGFPVWVFFLFFRVLTHSTGGETGLCQYSYTHWRLVFNRDSIALSPSARAHTHTHTHTHILVRSVGLTVCVYCCPDPSSPHWYFLVCFSNHLSDVLSSLFCSHVARCVWFNRCPEEKAGFWLCFFACVVKKLVFN